MKRVLVLVVLSLTLAACGSVVVAHDPYVGPPGYVYTYPSGGCWADDVWYPSCPWVVGPHYGYYYHYRSHYYYRPHTTWTYRPGRPPPRVRDHRPPPPRYRVPPPRVRDHRRR